MARYSVAATKDNLSSMIDKALAGEQVVITRYGKPVVELRLYDAASDRKAQRAVAFERLRELHDLLPMQTLSYIDLKKMDEAEGAL